MATKAGTPNQDEWQWLTKRLCELEEIVLTEEHDDALTPRIDKLDAVAGDAGVERKLVREQLDVLSGRIDGWDQVSRVAANIANRIEGRMSVVEGKLDTTADDRKREMFVTKISQQAHIIAGLTERIDQCEHEHKELVSTHHRRIEVLEQKAVQLNQQLRPDFEAMMRRNRLDAHTREWEQAKLALDEHTMDWGVLGWIVFIGLWLALAGLGLVAALAWVVERWVG